MNKKLKGARFPITANAADYFRFFQTAITQLKHNFIKQNENLQNLYNFANALAMNLIFTTKTDITGINESEEGTFNIGQISELFLTQMRIERKKWYSVGESSEKYGG